MTQKKRIILSATAAAAIAAAIYAAVVCHSLFARFAVGGDTAIYVYPTTSVSDVKEQLREQVPTVSFAGWNILHRLFPLTLRSGRYVVGPSDNMLGLYRRLRNGRQTPVRLTIPSVRRLARLAGTLAHNLMLDSAEVASAFADSAFTARYGYTTATLPALFIPNTYEVYWNCSLENLMQRMERENTSFWDAKGRNEAALAMGLSHEQVATLASIVDEETNYDPERATIAGLYLNRLHRGMLLQADPTVKFAVGDDTLRRIVGKHLQTDSPYNTYRYKGLPPGPIRIATIASIDAVLHAEQHDYLYFCAKEDFSGSHNFARNYDEHLANARRYQRALNERGIR